MELNKNNFSDNLLQILRHIARADFVAIDFEFSGIKMSSQSHRTIIERLGESGPDFDHLPSVQERYEELKEMASKYTILQVGITLAEQDKDFGGYVLRSYNAHLNPLIQNKLDIHRDFTVSSSAAEFLLKNKFDLTAPFMEGITYLSRDEHLRAIQLESERLDSLHVLKLDFDSLDAHAQQFIQQTRKRLCEWKPLSSDSYLWISSIQGPGHNMEMVHRRIVHQMLREEFPDLIATTQGTAMKVMPLVREREENHKREKMDVFFQRISRQVGFRWIIDALAGGSLNDLAPSDIITSDGPTWENMRAVRKRLDDVREDLKKHRPVLVGHNPFTDLVYLYSVFIGELPTTVEKFAERIHTMFPLVVDTKYLATHHGVMGESSLANLRDEYQRQSVPLIGPAPGFEETFEYYRSCRPAHQAGYDSYATALTAIRSAAKLATCFDWRRRLEEIALHRRINGLPNHILPSPDTRITDGVDGAEGEVAAAAATANKDAPTRKGERKRDKSELLIDLSEDEDAPAPPSKMRSVRENAYQLRAIFTPQMLCEWRDAEMAGGVGRGRGSGGAVRGRDGLLLLPPEELLPRSIEPAAADPERWTPDPADKGLPRWMPAWRSPFWRVFGNKLRINGTVEALLDLAEPAAPVHRPPLPKMPSGSDSYVRPWNELFRG